MVYKENFKKYSKEIGTFFSNKKVQNILIIILLLGILFVGTSIRLQNLPLLKDSTSGEYIPLALDPFYFLRVAETMNAGELPEFDSMRYPSLNVSWTNEVLPQSILLIYKVGKVFSPELTLRFADVLNPVVFFILGLILFFLLAWRLSKSKWIAIIGTGLLAIIPPYLYRTLAGFSDHESIGMFGFFLALLLFSIGLLYFDKKKLSLVKSGSLGIISGLATMFAVASWGGGAKFLFMILPLAFLISWFVRKEKSFKNRLLFYGLWILGVLIGAPLLGWEIVFVLKSYMLNSVGILSFFAFGYALVDSIVEKYGLFKKWASKKELINFGILIVLGGIIYQIFIGHFFEMVGNLIGNILYPFGTGRVGLTVAENKQPYLNDWIAQIGKFVFYTFLAGCFIVGAKVAKGIKIKKLRPFFTISFAFFVFGILFSRISATSVLNGNSFLSKALFFISFLTLAISSIYIYKKSEWKIKTEWILIVAWMIPMLFAVRSAIRVFFAIVPFVAFLVPLTIFEVGRFVKKSKEDLMKMFAWIVFAVLIIGFIMASVGFYKDVNLQATYTGPSANAQWQEAMSWIRDSTSEDSLFVHWWDYGYWVQTLGERATVTDGGHANGYWDHLIGRYVLTTPFPETAKSFVKSHDVDYLLIDPTDIGKYTAYSSIGSDESGDDRTSWLQTMISNPSEIQETRDGMTRIYQGGFGMDGDVYYENGEEEYFLPKESSIILGAVLEFTGEQVKQPDVVYVLNGNQVKLPVRYLYFNGELFDFKEGIESTLYLYPSVYQTNSGPQIDQTGAIMYLSEKVKDSLVAKLYLMNDPEDEYTEFELAYDNGGQGMYYYNGFVGPIKIWKMGEMENVLVNEEFLSLDGGYAEFDNLVFEK